LIDDPTGDGQSRLPLSRSDQATHERVTEAVLSVLEMSGQAVLEHWAVVDGDDEVVRRLEGAVTSFR
jgi:hypothetical protein